MYVIASAYHTSRYASTLRARVGVLIKLTIIHDTNDQTRKAFAALALFALSDLEHLYLRALIFPRGIRPYILRRLFTKDFVPYDSFSCQAVVAIFMSRLVAAKVSNENFSGQSFRKSAAQHAVCCR